MAKKMGAGYVCRCGASSFLLTTVRKHLGTKWGPVAGLLRVGVVKMRLPSKHYFSFQHFILQALLGPSEPPWPATLWTSPTRPATLTQHQCPRQEELVDPISLMVNYARPFWRFKASGAQFQGDSGKLELWGRFRVLGPLLLKQAKRQISNKWTNKIN